MKANDFKKYAGWFHDGDLIAINHNLEKNEITLTMNGCEITDDEDEFDKGLPLSKTNTIAGVLHLEGVKKIKINAIDFNGRLEKPYESGDITKLKVEPQSVLLSLHWVNHAPPAGYMDFWIMVFEAKNIWWENIPDLGDAW